MARIVLRLLNSVFGWVLGSAIALASVYAGYSIWDNFQIYASAANVQDALRQLKPDAEADGGPSFEELLQINGDVFAWLTVNGTNIDYPVLQGKDNQEYMNKDVYGENSLAGSIFLDVRNNKDLSDNYNLIYGHNMDDHLMFGDLALFKDKQFFSDKANNRAEIMLPGKKKGYRVAAILQLPAGTEEIFNPDLWKDSIEGFAEFLQKSSIYYRKSITDDMIKNPDNYEVVTLVTCSDGSTNDRTILVLVRRKSGVDDEYVIDDDDTEDTSEDTTESSESSSEQDDDSDNGNGGNHGGNGNGNGNSNYNNSSYSNGSDASDIGGSGPKQTGDNQHKSFWILLMLSSLVLILLYESMERMSNKRKEY